MSTTISDVLVQQAVRTIDSLFQKLSGQAATILTDNEQFRVKVIDPAWLMLPVAVRMVGRERLCWDRLMFKMRDEILEVKDGTILVRNQALTSVVSIVKRTLSEKPPQSVGLQPTDFPGDFFSSQQNEIERIRPETTIASITLPTGKSFLLTKNSVVIGSLSDCDMIVLGLQEQHARMRKIAGRWLIESLGSWLMDIGEEKQKRLAWLDRRLEILFNKEKIRLIFSPGNSLEGSELHIPPLGRMPNATDHNKDDASTLTTVLHGTNSTTHQNTVVGPDTYNVARSKPPLLFKVELIELAELYLSLTKWHVQNDVLKATLTYKKAMSLTLHPHVDKMSVNLDYQESSGKILGVSYLRYSNITLDRPLAIEQNLGAILGTKLNSLARVVISLGLSKSTGETETFQ